jgi:hypothetical protein
MMAISSRLCLWAAGVTFVTGSAFALTSNQRPAPATPLSSTTPGAPAEDLSEELNRSNDVIKEVDPAIEKPVPSVGDQNVVPPPETLDGAPAPPPK